MHALFPRAKLPYLSQNSVTGSAWVLIDPRAELQIINNGMWMRMNIMNV